MPPEKADHFHTKSFKKIIFRLLIVIGAAEIPLLAYWNANLGQIRPEAVIKPALMTLGCAVVFFLLFSLVLRNFDKSGLLVLWLTLILFSYGHVLNLLSPVGSLKIARPLFFFYILLLLAGIFLLLRIKKVSRWLFGYFALVVGIIFIFNCLQIGLFEPSFHSQVTVEDVTINNVLQKGDPPDIYYIVLDSYSRDDVLKDEFGFDNSEFLEALRGRDFFVPACGLANYESTYTTIPSVLNMDYLDHLGIADADLTKIKGDQVNLIFNSAVRRIFVELGYQFVTTRGYAAFNDIQDSDIYLNYYHSQGQSDELATGYFLYQFMRTTLLGAVLEMSPSGSEQIAEESSTSQIQTTISSGIAYEEADFWYHQTEYVFDEISDFPNQPGAYLVYAHINAPHHPYVFNQDGSFRYVTDFTHEKQYYVDSVISLNHEILDVIDSIIAESETPPIIILQADHGSHQLGNGLIKHKILSAYYLPGDVDIKPYDTITPVNDFRLVLHDYFDPSITLLPDKLYVNNGDSYLEENAYCDH